MKITNLKYPYLSIVLLALTVAISSLHAGMFGPFYYSITEDDRHVTITGYDNSPGDFVIPAEIDGRTVTKIGNGAFARAIGLTSIFLPDSVTEIGSSAFADCRGLSSITIPKSVTSIGPDAFARCKGLTSIHIPGNVTSIGRKAFTHCTGLTSIHIPGSVTSIGSNAFSHCTGLTSIYIPGSVTSIGSNAFTYCTGLNSIHIPGSVTTIGSSAFSSCSGLTTISIPAGVTTIGDHAFFACTGLASITVEASNPSYTSEDGVLFSADKSVLILYPKAKTGAYFIPDTVAEISDQAFSGCTGLTSVTIPEGVTIIGQYAFSGCSEITSVTIPSSVTAIGPQAFAACIRLTEIVVGSGNPSFASEGGVLFNSAMTKLIDFPTGRVGPYTIPGSVTIIGQDAFSGCSEITSVTIPPSVTDLSFSPFPPSYPFSGCANLRQIVVAQGNPIFSSHDGVLYNAAMTMLLRCPEGKTGHVQIPEGVITLSWHFDLGKIDINPGGRLEMKSHTFAYCSELTRISFPSTFEKNLDLDARVFSNCQQLQAFEVATDNPELTSVDGVLIDKARAEVIAVPRGRTGAFTIPDQVTAIGCHSFEGGSLTTVTIPNSVIRIDCTAFRNCRRLSSAVFLGDAPSTNGGLGASGVSPKFTIYYLAGSTGFTSPTWEGYPSVQLDATPSPSEAWLLEHGLPHDTDLLHDHNGVGLLTAYALNLDPNNNPSSNLPEPRLSPEALTLTFHAASPGISYTVETSTDLQTWTTDGVILSDLDAENQRTASVSRDSTRRFLRLVVSETP